MFFSCMRPLAHLLIAIALSAAAAAAAAGAGQQTWRATLIDGSQQGCVPPVTGLFLIQDFTVMYHGDDFGAYPPVLFANASYNGVYLGGAHASAAGYAYGWTWAGTCMGMYPGVSSILLPSTPCACNVNLQPTGGSDCHDLLMYMVCSIKLVQYNLESTAQCLGNYKLVAVNASSLV